ncbi:MAG TPA: GntG family PLP-dependent aldolase [Mycobacteriales bacterium]|nr:GntG family PLP-dependent aldolase [Mycobacteriales bacterium]
MPSPSIDRPVDLRSDTVTRPSDAVRAAMAAAEVGDDQYGEDPSVRALEEEVAGLLGHEAAVFVPSGTMGNLTALRALAEPGTEVLAEAHAHIVMYESGGLAALGGVQTRTLPGVRGILDPQEIAAELGDAAFRTVPTRVVAIENTHVRSGGSVWSVAQVAAMRDAVAPAGVALHCDGARLWNAAVATGADLADYGRLCTTLSVCLSKGLGAPVGSLVVTDAERSAPVRLWRKRLGGALRQSGVLAAAGLHVVRHHRERLADDHARAHRLAQALAEAAPDVVDLAQVQTNLVVLRVDDAAALAGKAAEEGVLCGLLGPQTIRLVTHLDVDDAGITHAVDVLTRLLTA